MKTLISSVLFVCFSFLPSFGQNISITGTLWTELDLNSTYDGEQGKNNVKVYLISIDIGQIIDISYTQNFEFNFPSNDSLIIFPGDYVIEIAEEEFEVGGTLENFISCPGFSQADDGVDLDDNGQDSYPTKTTPFTLDTGFVEHIDLCFFSDCNEEINSAKLSCAEIKDGDIFCSITSLHNLCGLLPTTNSPGIQPNPLCPDGGGPHNISWFAFIADEGEYQLTVTPTGCFGSTIGIEGVQMGLYTDCTFTESVYCNYNCSLNPVTLDSGLLTPGETYYFFVDGCSSSVCSYEIVVTGNPIPPITEVDEICILKDGDLICEDAEYCIGEEIVFEANGVNLNAAYSWQITTIDGEPFTGLPLQFSEENALTLDIEDIGVYSVCLTNIELQCTGLNWEGNQCRVVTINGTQDEIFGATPVCENEIEDFDAELLSMQDPNGDGIEGWIDSDYEFNFGFNQSLVMDSNQCSYLQEVFIVQVVSPLAILILATDELCIGDSLEFSYPNSEFFDSLVWTINGIPQEEEAFVLYPDIGEYNVFITVYDQCSGTSNEVTFQVSDTISAPDLVCDTSTIGSIHLSWPKVEGIEGYSISINGNVPDITSDTFYIIDNLDQGEVVNISFNLFGSYKCIGSDKTFNCTAPTSVGINEHLSNELKIIPNPANDYIYIDGGEDLLKTSYTIYSTEGKLHQSGKMVQSEKIDVAELQPGLYILTLIGDDGKLIKAGKFIKR